MYIIILVNIKTCFICFQDNKTLHLKKNIFHPTAPTDRPTKPTHPRLLVLYPSPIISIILLGFGFHIQVGFLLKPTRLKSRPGYPRTTPMQRRTTRLCIHFRPNLYRLFPNTRRRQLPQRHVRP
ncbi:hypothetical protein Hanom_Chr09g00861771 [Helianthus anomalus]